MEIKFTEQEILLNGQAFNRAMVERLLQIPQGSIENLLGNDPSVKPLLRIVCEFPEILEAAEEGLTPEAVDQAMMKAFRRRYP